MIRWFERNYAVAWMIVLIIAGLIFYVSSLIFPYNHPGISLLSVIYHIGIFFLFSFFLMIALVRGKNKKIVLLGFVLALAYGFSDEIHQLFVPGRYGSLVDVFYDGVGVLFATIIYLIIVEGRKKMP
ncbi:VanZ family protein [Candidatus Pacearchaeota archaeon]|nr:VanZ family protein [Candidatus Pacearchaeota archaeon]